MGKLVGGDNRVYTLYVKQPRLSPQPEAASRAIKDRICMAKDLENRRAAKETQLVKTYPSPSLGEPVLSKVAEIRRMLRRRYQNHSDVKKIFKNWDLSCLGAIRPIDVLTMMAKLGMPVSLEEASQLVASACKSKAGKLSLCEFMELVHDDNDQLNVDISNLKAGQDCHSQVNKLSMSLYAEKAQDKLRLLLKQKAAQVTEAMCKADTAKSGLLSLNCFVETITRLKIPPSIASEQQITALFKACGGDDRGISYKHFSKQLGLNSQATSDLTLSSEEKLLQRQPVKPSQRPLKVLDPRTQPPNKLKQIYKRGEQIKAALQQEFRTPEALMKALEAVSEGRSITQAKLVKFLEVYCQDNYQSQLEGFLSAFVYNTEGCTEVTRLTKYVFQPNYEAETDLELKYRALPPSRSDFAEGSPNSLENLMEQIDRKIMQIRTTKSWELMKLLDLDRDGYVSAGDMQGALAKFGISRGHLGESGILGKPGGQSAMEGVHSGSMSIGGISCSLSEAAGLIDFLTADKKGHMTINDVSQSFQLEMAQTNSRKLGKPSLLNSTQPSTEFLQRQLSATQSVNSFYRQLHSKLQPTLGKTMPVSRVHPANKSTFSTVQADMETSMYLSEGERLVRKSFEPINIGRDDKRLQLINRTAQLAQKRTEMQAVRARHACSEAAKSLRTHGKLAYKQS
jgi:Ca2+-binding EF-hand superfamily protein